MPTPGKGAPPSTLAATSCPWGDSTPTVKIIIISSCFACKQGNQIGDSFCELIDCHKRQVNSYKSQDIIKLLSQYIVLVVFIPGLCFVDLNSYDMICGALQDSLCRVLTSSTQGALILVINKGNHHIKA